MEVITERVPQFVVDVSDPSQTGEARRAVVRCAAQINMDESDRGAVAIAVTELATNVLKHAKQGRIVCEPVAQNGARGIRLIAIDKGPGIRNVAAALQDGYSTAGSNGSGLGAVKRLSTRFDIYTVPDEGTCICAEFWTGMKPASSSLELGVLSVPIRGESVCGDGWLMKSTVQSTWLMVVDGLGHGVYAAEAARETERVVAIASSNSPAEVLRDCHDALKKTRGAAVALAAIDVEKGTLCFSGLGNISATLLSHDRSHGLTSHNGTAGHHIHRTQEFTFPWNYHSILVMHSDGLGSRWDLRDYPGLRAKPASIIAAVLYRDFCKGRDDTTVLVAKNPTWA